MGVWRVSGDDVVEVAREVGVGLVPGQHSFGATIAPPYRLDLSPSWVGLVSA